ncbi:MAG: GNAT family N-acetyltransferase [Verrucomicrobia bacterium]|nr:GNAT family N-acetyltransferase [Verrucomicrobiota bacterium]
MPNESTHRAYLISDDSERLDPEAIHAYLSRSYWAASRSREVIVTSLANSLCIGVYNEMGEQVGFARVISDYATFAYLCDVYVLEAHRAQGLAKAVLRFINAHPRLQGLRRFHLVTRDAHGLYAQFGFTPIANPERHMERRTFP